MFVDSDESRTVVFNLTLQAIAIEPVSIRLCTGMTGVGDAEADRNT